MLATATGWTEHFILWELPLERLLAYEHANLRSKDVWTVSRNLVTQTALPSMAAFFDAAPSTESEDDDDYL
jgi:hypothetical protein